MPLCRPHWTCNSVFPIAPQMPCPAPGPEVSAATSCRSKVVQSAPQSVFGFQVLDHFFFLCKWEGCLCTCKYNCVEVRGQHGCWPSITVHLTGIFLFCFFEQGLSLWDLGKPSRPRGHPFSISAILGGMTAPSLFVWVLRIKHRFLWGKHFPGKLSPPHKIHDKFSNSRPATL